MDILTEDSHVNHSVQPKAQVNRRPKHLFPYILEGSKCRPRLVFLENVEGIISSKQETEKVFSNMSSEAWKKWVTQQRQEYLARAKSVHPINESESLLWGTPTVMSRPRSEATLQKCLEFRQKHGKNSVPLYLEEQVMKWPTPTSRDWKDGGKLPPSRQNVNKQTLPQRMAYLGQQDPTNPSSTGKNQESWATPNTMDSLPQRSEEALRRQAQTSRKGRKKPANLREQVDPKAVEIYKEESKQWPTPSVSDPEGGSQADRVEWTETGAKLRKKGKPHMTYGAKLRDAVEAHEKNWPTPTVAEAGKIANNPNYGQLGLSNHPAVHGRELDREKLHKDRKGLAKAPAQWPSPRLMTGGTCKNGVKHGDLNSTAGGKLNPNWVEHLMGVEPQWTQLPTEWTLSCWATELFPQQQKGIQILAARLVWLMKTVVQLYKEGNKWIMSSDINSIMRVA